MTVQLILSNRDSEDRRAIGQACELRSDVFPWPLESWRVPRSLTDLNGRGMRLYAEPLFADVVAGQLGLALIEAPLDWLMTCPRRFLGRTVMTMPLDQARRIVHPAFVKALDDKSIEPKVYLRGRDLPDYVEDDVIVLVSSPARWKTEFRLFILNGDIYAASTYLVDGEPKSLCPTRVDDLQRFVDAVFDEAGESLPAAFVMDVGMDSSFNWSVVECNAAWGSGLYACNPNGALDVILASTMPVDSVTEDREFVRKLPEVVW